MKQAFAESLLICSRGAVLSLGGAAEQQNQRTY